MDLLGFDDEFLENLLDFETDENATEEKEEREKVFREPKEERVKKGDIWQLGKHRLLCGDSTDLEQIKELLQGEKVGLLLTDPPYGINVVNGESLGTGNKASRQILYKEVKNDHSIETARKNYELIKDFTENQIIFVVMEFYGNLVKTNLSPSNLSKNASSAFVPIIASVGVKPPFKIIERRIARNSAKMSLAVTSPLQSFADLVLGFFASSKSFQKSITSS